MAFWQLEDLVTPADFNDGFGFREAVQFTTSGSFTKATYPWLRAVMVHVQAGGGAGAGAGITAAGEASCGGGGSGGGYTRKWILVASLAASETVTVGSGGTGVAASAGNNGQTSSFGTFAVANGGLGGQYISPRATVGISLAAQGGAAATGDLLIPGDPGVPAVVLAGGTPFAPSGGTSALGAGGVSGSQTTAAQPGQGFGGGGGGHRNAPNQGTGRTGGAGAAGVVIVDLYA